MYTDTMTQLLLFPAEIETARLQWLASHTHADHVHPDRSPNDDPMALQRIWPCTSSFSDDDDPFE